MDLNASLKHVELCRIGCYLNEVEPVRCHNVIPVRIVVIVCIIFLDIV